MLTRPVDGRWPINEDNPFGADAAVYASLGVKGHPGIDFKCPEGTPVVACADGEVVYAGWAGSAGFMVELRHAFGRTRYLHLSGIQTSAGLRVARGEVIGASGNTGLSFGPHLHLDFYPAGEPEDNGYRGRVDPTPYLA